MKKTFELFEKSWLNVYRNKISFLVGSILLHAFFSSVVVFVISQFFKLILASAGFKNLNFYNFYDIFLNPISAVLSIFYVIIIAFFTFLEFAMLISMIRTIRQNDSFSLKIIFRRAFRRLKSISGVQILFFVLYFVSMVPLSNLGLGSTLSEKLQIPQFIATEVFKTKTGALIYSAVVGAIFYFNLRLIFVLPLTVSSHKKFSKNIKESWALTKGNLLKLIFITGVFEIILAGFLIASFSIFDFLLHRFGFLLGVFWVEVFRATVLNSAFFILAVFSKIFVVDLLLNFMDSKDEATENVRNEEKKKKRSRFLVFLIAVLLLSSLAVNGFEVYSRKQNFFNLKKKPLILAHRGDNSGAVENSIEALESAKKNGADFVETDVISTADGEMVIFHDFDLNRLAGISKRVQDLTLKELQQIEISQNGFSAKIPSLDEFLSKSKELKIGLFIELKIHSGEPSDYFEKFVRKVKKYKLEHQIRVNSMNEEVALKVKKIAPEIKVGVVAPVVFGDFDWLKPIDFYAVEDSSYRKRFAKDAFLNGKEIFVWTINGEENLSKYLEFPVSGVITDETSLANEIFNSKNRK